MGVHDGHRKNLRQNFLLTGLKGKTEHQALELLLTYSVPRIDVNPLAHELINRFSSLSGVIDADAEELVKIPHITENTVVLLKLIPALAQMYSDSKWSDRPHLNTSSKVTEFLRPKFLGCRNEKLYMLCLDTHLKLNELVLLSEGTPDSSSVHIRTVVQNILRTDAKQIILSHNHPSGSAEPSVNDVLLTQTLKDALAHLDIIFIDHIIFAGNETFSFRSNGMMKGILKK